MYPSLTRTPTKTKKCENMEFVCMDARCHRLFVNACEMGKSRRTDHHRNAGIPQTDIFSCPVDGCYKRYAKEGSYEIVFIANLLHRR